MTWTSPRFAPARPRGLVGPGLAVLLAVGSAGCASTTATFGEVDRFGPELDRSGVPSVSVEQPAYVSVYQIGGGIVEMVYPFVPPGVAETRWPYPPDFSPQEIRAFQTWNPDVDLTRNPVEDPEAQPLLAAGEDRPLRLPSWGFRITETRGRFWPHGASYTLMVTTSAPQRLEALDALGREFAPADPWDISRRILASLGLEEGAEGWSAALYRGVPIRPDNDSYEPIAVHRDGRPFPNPVTGEVDLLPPPPTPPSTGGTPPKRGGGG